MAYLLCKLKIYPFWSWEEARVKEYDRFWSR